jgi:PhzF family phenazine biosynthesis protein
MGQSVVQVDAFAEGPFTGNPAAVCVMRAARSAAWRQAVALEMNLSETAFLVPEGDAWRLRWFTPAVEVALCGHATLASAHALWEAGHAKEGSTLQFETLSGRLTASRDGEWITLDFPARIAEASAPPEGLVESIGADPVWVGSNGMDYLYEVESESAVRSVRPDLGKLLTVKARGVIVTARSDDRAYHFVSRFFGPAAGVNEDPVTGSAHCCLAPHWGKRLGLTEMVGKRVSARSGVVKVRLAGDRVLLGGKAVTTLRGELSEAVVSAGL